MANAIGNILSVIYLFAAGYLLRRLDIIREETVADLKKLVLNLGLPALLFMAFLKTKFQGEYLYLILIIFAVCTMIFALGFPLGKLFFPKSRFFHVVFASVETGMLGYALFTSVFGADNAYRLAIVDLGHVFFVILLLYPHLYTVNGEKHTFGQTVKSALTMPLTIGAFMGILLSVSGLGQLISGNPVLGSSIKAVSLVSTLTVPIICMCIGYELRLKFKGIEKILLAALLRLAVYVMFAFMINHFIIDGLLHLDKTFQIAMYTLFILPPTFGIPMCIGNDHTQDRDLVLNFISVSLVLSLLAFLAILLLV